MSKHAIFPGELVTREAGEGRRVIAGYFIRYGDEYSIDDYLTETVNPGACDGITNEDDIRALVNHDTTLVLGRTTARTLTLTPDDRGLYGEIEINEDDTAAMDVYARVARGDVTQCSFGALRKAIDYDTEYLPNGKTKWHITRVRPHEISICTFPAYESTGVTARGTNLSKDDIDRWKETMLTKVNKE